MDVNTLKSKLGRWLHIDEVRSLLAHLPESVVNGIPVNRKLLETASEFVERKAGWWEHEDWSGFLEALAEQGFNTAETFRPAIGSILEGFKACYHRGEFGTITEKRRQPVQPRKPRTAKKARPARAANPG